MRDPKNLLYTKSHEWVELLDDGTAFVGLDDYAQNELGDLVFINLPEIGDEVVAGEPFGDVESVKAVSDIYSPVSGKVAEINEDVLDNPAAINEDAFGAWLIKVEEITDKADLLDADAIAEVAH